MITPEKLILEYSRLANLRDTDEVAKMMETFVGQTTYNVLPFSKRRTYEAVEKFIVQSPDVSLVAVSVDDNGKPVGVIAGIITNLIFSEEDIAMEIAWYVDPTADNLKKRHFELRAIYEEWARKQGARFAQYAHMNPTEQDLRALLKRQNTEVFEIVYHRELT